MSKSYNFRDADKFDRKRRQAERNRKREQLMPQSVGPRGKMSKELMTQAYANIFE